MYDMAAPHARPLTTKRCLFRCSFGRPSPSVYRCWRATAVTLRIIKSFQELVLLPVTIPCQPLGFDQVRHFGTKLAKQSQTFCQQLFRPVLGGADHRGSAAVAQRKW